LQKLLPVAMRAAREIFVPSLAVDSRFVAGETGFEARNPSARGVHAKQEVKD
jgi:hypothetical protein